MVFCFCVFAACFFSKITTENYLDVPGSKRLKVSKWVTPPRNTPFINR